MNATMNKNNKPKRFFDIQPPKSGEGKKSLRSREMIRFGVVALVAFFLMNLSNIISRGMDFMGSSRDLAEVAYEDFGNGVEALKKKDFASASSSFTEAKETLTKLKNDSKYLMSEAKEGAYLDMGNKLLDAGMLGAELGESISSVAFEVVKKSVGLSLENSELLPLVQVGRDWIKELRGKTVEIQNKLAAISPSLLSETSQLQLQKTRVLVETMDSFLREADRYAEVLQIVLGDKTPHRVLILLQNHQERRATGGFIGSYVIVDINDGKISQIEPKDVYESDGQLSVKLPPPPGIAELTDHYAMRDANYDPDFPTSAEKIMWFLEHSRGPSVDTVVALDQSIVESLLDLQGGVKLPELPVKLTGDNFNTVMSFYVEAKLDRRETPKALMFELIPIFQKEWGNLNKLMELKGELQKWIAAGHLQFYSKDPKVQSLIETYHADGKLVNPAEKTDYLNIITTSIGGNKSDGYIHENIAHTTSVDLKGEIADELTITKKHTWSYQEENAVRKLGTRFGLSKDIINGLIQILGGGKNRDYMRIYVPKGSQLISAEGVKQEDIKVTESSGYTVWGFVFGPVLPSEEESVVLKYRLPFKLQMKSGDFYRFIAEPQAGAENINLTKKLTTENGVNIIKNYPESQAVFSLTPEVSTPWNSTFIFLSALSSSSK